MDSSNGRWFDPSHERRQALLREAETAWLFDRQVGNPSKPGMPRRGRRLGRLLASLAAVVAPVALTPGHEGG